MPSSNEVLPCHELAQLINQRPAAERLRYQAALRRFSHDMGHNIGLIRTSEGLLRQTSEPACLDEELLGIIREGASGLTRLLDTLRALSEAIEGKN